MDRLDPMAGPPAPVLRVPLRVRMTCLRQFGKGSRSEAGGSPVAVARLGPKGIAPEIAMVTSPEKARPRAAGEATVTATTATAVAASPRSRSTARPGRWCSGRT